MTQEKEIEKTKIGEDGLRVVIVSDTHGKHEELNLPKGDILIHCGDFTSYGRLQHITSFQTW